MRVLFDLLAMSLAVISIAFAFRAYRRLPERIPVHFGFSGHPDGWGPRAMLWLLPVLGVVGLMGLGVAQSLAPVLSHSAALSLLELEQQALFLYILWAQVEIGMRRAERIGPAIWVILALLIGTSFFIAT